MSIDHPVLLVDIGATFSRLAVFSPGKGVSRQQILENREFPGPEALLQHYFTQIGDTETPPVAAMSVAGAVSSGTVTVTNLGWRIDADALREQFSLDRVHLLNDFHAVALAIPRLPPGGVLKIGTGEPVAGAAIGVLGPGSGLGVAGLLAGRQGWVTVVGEGGHVSLPLRDDMELEIFRRLSRRFGHVSAERVLSGPGIENIYRALAEEHGGLVSVPGAEEISRRAAAGKDPVAQRSLDCFFRMLGTVAGNLALTLGALGGIYLAGGILPRMRSALLASGFRERFVDKGRFQEYLEAVPTFLITEEVPAFLGLLNFLEDAG